MWEVAIFSRILFRFEILKSCYDHLWIEMIFKEEARPKHVCMEMGGFLQIEV